MPEVRAVVLDEPWDRHMQDGAGHEADDPRVVDREHDRVVSGLALVGGIAAFHRSPGLAAAVAAVRHTISATEGTIRRSGSRIGRVG